MAFASNSGGKENPCLGVKITEGQGNLPKVVLTYSQGRYVFSGLHFQFLIFTLHLCSGVVISSKNGLVFVISRC